MKYLNVAAILAGGLLATSGAAWAQHHGGHQGGAHAYGNAHGIAHGGHGSIHIGPGVLRTGVYAVPFHGGYSQPGYIGGGYVRPFYAAPLHGGVHSGHGYDVHGPHHERYGHHGRR